MNQNPNTTGRPSSTGDGSVKKVADEAKHLAKSTVDQAKDLASTAVSQAREQASAKLGTQKDRAVDKIGEVAHAVRAAGGSIEDGPLPDLAERAADGIEGLANWFKSRTVGDIIGEVERFGRREPAIFLGTSFALGLIGGRFLKSSQKSSRSAGRYEGMGMNADDHFGEDPFGVDEQRFRSMRGLDYRGRVPPPAPPARVQVRPMVSVQGQQGQQGQAQNHPSTTTPGTGLHTPPTGGTNPTGNRSGGGTGQY